MGFSQQSLEPVELSQAERKMRTDVLMRSLTMVMLVLCPLLKWVLGKPSDVKIIRCLSCPPVAGSRQHLLVPSGYLHPFDLNGNTLYFWCPTSVRRVNSHCKIFWRKALLPQESVDMERKPRAEVQCKALSVLHSLCPVGFCGLGLPYQVFSSVIWLLCVVWIHKAVICIASTLWALLFVDIWVSNCCVHPVGEVSYTIPVSSCAQLSASCLV